MAGPRPQEGGVSEAHCLLGGVARVEGQGSEFLLRFSCDLREGVAPGWAGHSGGDGGWGRSEESRSGGGVGGPGWEGRPASPHPSGRHSWTVRPPCWDTAVAPGPSAYVLCSSIFLSKTPLSKPGPLQPGSAPGAGAAVRENSGWRAKGPLAEAKASDSPPRVWRRAARR